MYAVLEYYNNITKKSKTCNVFIVELVYNGHLGVRYIWPLYTMAVTEKSLHRAVSSILEAMTIIKG